MTQFLNVHSISLYHPSRYLSINPSSHPLCFSCSCSYLKYNATIDLLSWKLKKPSVWFFSSGSNRNPCRAVDRRERLPSVLLSNFLPKIMLPVLANKSWGLNQQLYTAGSNMSDMFDRYVCLEVKKKKTARDTRLFLWFLKLQRKRKYWRRGAEAQRNLGGIVHWKKCISVFSSQSQKMQS